MKRATQSSKQLKCHRCDRVRVRSHAASLIASSLASCPVESEMDRKKAARVLDSRIIVVAQNVCATSDCNIAEQYIFSIIASVCAMPLDGK